MLPISVCNFRQYVAFWAASDIAFNHNICYTLLEY